MTLFAHHMAVELFGREFSPHGVFQHVCAFAAIAFLLGTSTYGVWCIARSAAKTIAGRNRDAAKPPRLI